MEIMNEICDLKIGFPLAETSVSELKVGKIIYAVYSLSTVPHNDVEESAGAGSFPGGGREPRHPQQPHCWVGAPERDLSLCSCGAGGQLLGSPRRVCVRPPHTLLPAAFASALPALGTCCFRYLGLQGLAAAVPFLMQF